MEPGFLSVSKIRTWVWVQFPFGFRVTRIAAFVAISSEQDIPPISILFRYGYIDPQNNVREFSYKSGNPCDPETKQELNPDPSPDFGNTQKARFQSGNFDYTDNKFVLPSGKRGTLTVNKKNRARG